MVAAELRCVHRGDTRSHAFCPTWGHDHRHGIPLGAATTTPTTSHLIAVGPRWKNKGRTLPAPAKSRSTEPRLACPRGRVGCVCRKERSSPDMARPACVSETMIAFLIF